MMLCLGNIGILSIELVDKKFISVIITQGTFEINHSLILIGVTFLAP